MGILCIIFTFAIFIILKLFLNKKLNIWKSSGKRIFLCVNSNIKDERGPIEQ